MITVIDRQDKTTKLLLTITMIKRRSKFEVPASKFVVMVPVEVDGSVEGEESELSSVSVCSKKINYF